MLRVPRFRFRPGHADGLHLDLWHGGINIVRDGGSYSYADAVQNGFYQGAGGHSTVIFDERDQMPRVGRFLFGKWLFSNMRAPQKNDRLGEDTFEGAYTDWLGASHRRMVSFKESSLIVRDAVSGFKRQAVVNWRLCPGEWLLKGDRAESAAMLIEFSSDQPLEARLTESRESRFYLDEASLPVLQISLGAPGEVTTQFHFRQSQIS
jgi:Heparinase II/III-like protein